MQKKWMTVFSLLTIVGLMFAGCAGSETKQKGNDTVSVSTATVTEPKEANVPRDSASMMKAWQAYMTPGDMQKMLASFVGTWNEEVTSWHEAGAQPKMNASVGVSKMILGGRYLQTVHTGSFDGMPFEGIETMGYDNSLKVLVSSWVDNMGSGIMNSRGTWDASTKTFEMKGKSVDPLIGKEVDVRQVIKIVDDKTHIVEMYMNENGKEFKSMEIKCTRK